MGRGMARNLHKAGLLRAVWNRTTARADELAAELGVVTAANPTALARDCDVIALCVSADADVLAVSQSDGSVRVEFTARGDLKQDPGLVDRVSAAYDRRMGR